MSAPTKRGRGRPSLPPETQRNRLLDAAERCFERDRYERTRVQDIAREAGMSTRSCYALFGSKEELVEALARDRADVFLAHMDEVMRDAQAPLEAIDRLLRLFLELLPVVLIDLERAGGPAGERARVVRAEYRARIGEALLVQIERLAEQGLIPAMPDPTSVLLVIAGIESLTIRYHEEGRREELLALHPQLLHAVRELFPAWLGRGPRSHN